MVFTPELEVSNDPNRDIRAMEDGGLRRWIVSRLRGSQRKAFRGGANENGASKVRRGGRVGTTLTHLDSSIARM